MPNQRHNPVFETRIQWGETLPAWEPKIVWAGPFFAVIAPLFYIAALLGDPDPARFFQGGQGVASYAIIGVQVVVFSMASALIAARRAVGLLILNVAFFYAAMIVNALGIAWIALASWQAGVMTLVLVAWSLWGTWRVNASVGAPVAQQIHAELFDTTGAHPVMHSPGVVKQGGAARAALEGKRSALAVVLEFAGVVAIFLIGPGLIAPLGIVGGFSESGMLAWILWLVCCAIFLAGRGVVNTWLLYGRAMQWTDRR